MRAPRRPSRRPVPTPAATTVQWEVSSSGGNAFTAIDRGDLDHRTASYGQRGKTATSTRRSSPTAAAISASNPATLTVDYVTVTRPGSQTVDAGTTVTFTATPAPTQRHMCSGIVSTAGGNAFSPSPGRPRPPTASRPAARKTATSTRRSSATAAAISPATPPQLTVDYAPTVTTDPVSQTVNAGKHGDLHGGGHGNPAPPCSGK